MCNVLVSLWWNDLYGCGITSTMRRLAMMMIST